MSEIEQLTQFIGLAIGLCTLGVFVWRVSLYFWKKSKCFDALKQSVKNTEEDLLEVKKQMLEEIKEAKNTHIEIFRRMNDSEKKLAFIAGKHGYEED